MSKLLDILQDGLRKLANQHTCETLGDRTTYLGASEVGQCPRKTILSKLHPAEHNLDTLLRFRRGHYAEDVVAEALTAMGWDFERQTEINRGKNVAHIDFVFTSEASKSKSVLEIKSTEKIPQTPYSSWETQLYLQMGLLAGVYPDYSVRGAILVVPLGGGARLFDGYTPDSNLTEGLLTRATGIWTDYQRVANGEDVDLTTEFSPLCGFCEHISTCPKFAADEVDELKETVEELVALQARQKELADQIDARKAELQAIASQRGAVKVADVYLREVTRNRKVFDMARLGEFLSGHGCSVEDFQDNRPYSFLEIKKAA